MKLTSDLSDKIDKLQEGSTESLKQGQQQRVLTLSDVSVAILRYTKLQNKDGNRKPSGQKICTVPSSCKSIFFIGNQVISTLPPVMQINATNGPCLPNRIKIVGLQEQSMTADKIIILLFIFK